MDNDNLSDLCTEAEDSPSEYSISSTSTADPESGRLPGKVCAFIGRRLEVAASRFMEKRGYGPEASRKRLESLCSGAGPLYDPVKDRKCQKEAKKLLKFVRSKFVSNQQLALEAIVDLATHNRARQVLIELDATKIIALVSLQAEVENCDQLLFRCRKALSCLEDTKKR
ncbi:hypothetical protein DFH11DRAFT_1727627 [Phellopilus nigrolimitatus]|nr:hypothetical protein DFH11DRAFT_1727627 [Phellopilus nigrolimitatus]